MADADLRRLEREARTDPLAAQRLQAERCRRDEHLPPHWPEGLLGVERVVAQGVGHCERWCWQCPACHGDAEFLGERLEDVIVGGGLAGHHYRSPPWRDALAQREAARMGYTWSNGRWVGGPPDSEMDRDGYDRDRDYDLEGRW